MSDKEDIQKTMREVKKEVFTPDAAGINVADLTGTSETELKQTYITACQQLQAGQVKGAAKLFAMLCALDHANGKNWRGLGLSMQRMKMWPVASFAFRRALHLDPADVVSRVFIAEVLLQQRRPSQARIECERAIEDARRLGKPQHAAYLKRGEKLLGLISGADAGEQSFER